MTEFMTRYQEREARQARMRQLADEAMNDPGFVADMQATMAAFRHVDAETWLNLDDETEADWTKVSDSRDSN